MKHGLVLLLLAVSPIVVADTIYLKNGVEFDGVVTPVPENPDLFKVTAGERSLIYRAEEIDRIEKNDRTGKLSKEEILARWQETDRQLTEETGLTADQRRLLEGLMFELKTDNAAKRMSVREQIIALQKEFDAYKYLAAQLPGVSTLVAPYLLETLAYMDGPRTVPLLEEATTHNYAGMRSMAIEILGRLGNAGSKALIARGLVDQMQEVQISAAYNLAKLGAREATPALIELLANPDQRVSNASRDALRALWSGVMPDPAPTTVSEWKALWDGQEKHAGAIELAALESLSDPKAEITTSIDSNHGVGSGVSVATAEP